jgi:Fe-S-cluster containining protein
MPGILCEHCTAACCRYIALPIDTPETRAEFEDVRWYLLHENISVFVEDGEWYINMATPCRHLQPDQRCGIYATRPRICRKYTTENCDYHSGDYGWEHHFTCPEHLDEYLRTHLDRNGKIIKNAKIKQASGNGSQGRKSKPRQITYKPRNSKNGHPPAGAPTDIAGIPLPILGNLP